ncbi:MAG: ribonuclease P protein component [Candidatus Sumerlaeia bacterium]
MFPKSHRLLHRRDFLRVYAEGASRSGRHVWVYYLDRGDGATARVGITIPRRAGKAVRRNKTRRRLREILRHLGPRLRPGYDIVVNCGPNTVNLDFAQLKSSVTAALTAAHLLNDEPASQDIDHG